MANQKKTLVGRGAAIAELEERLHVTANAQLAFGPLIVTGGRIATRSGTLLFGVTPASALPAVVDLFNTEGWALWGAVVPVIAAKATFLGHGTLSSGPGQQRCERKAEP
jgi:hypothetical protein